MRFRLLAGYFRRYAARFAAGIGMLLVTNALVLSIPWILKRAVEEMSAGTTTSVVAGYALAIAAIATIQAFARTASRLAILGASRLVAYDLRRRLFERLLVQPPAWYERMRTGDLMSRAVNDMQLIRSFYGPGVLNFVNTTVSYAGSLAIMALINPRLCLLALIPYPFVILFMNRLSRALYRRSRLAQEQLATLSSRIQESLSGIQQVKAFVREPAEIAELGELAREYRRKNLDLARIRGAIVPLMGSIGGIGTLVVLYFGGRHVVEGRMSLGDFVAFNSYLAGLAWPTLAMGWILNVVQRAMGAADRIGEVLHAGDERALPVGARVAPSGSDLTPEAPGASGETGASPPGIRFRSLTFRYEDAPEPALADLDIEIPSGGSLGVVGPVGSGKSTLLALLSGQYDPPEGSILIGGRDIRTMDLDSLRSLVVTVPQESFLFARSISDNIAFGRPAAPLDEISRAAALASLDPDLNIFPRGIDTLVGERGVTLSGGQRQRVALARALLVDPRVLILDDTLSAVDAMTEVAILENLKPVLAGRTCLVASHRFSAVRDLDRIIVLDAGRVVESGTHDELLAADGLYARMHRRQQLEQELQQA